MAKLSYFIDTRTATELQPCPIGLNISHHSVTLRIPLGIRVTREKYRLAMDRIKKMPQERWTQTEKTIYAYMESYEIALADLSRSMDISALSVGELKEELEALVTGIRKERVIRRYGRGKKVLFTDYYRVCAERKETAGTRKIYTRTLKKIYEFDQNADRLRFEDVTKDWLRDFDQFMQTTLSPNIRNMYLRNIRAVFNEAISDDLTKDYPFRKFKMPKLQETRKRALTVDQIRLLRDCDCDEWMQEYRDMFMLMFYLIGINAADLFKAKDSDIVNGRLEYRREKTHKLYSVKIEPEAQALIDKYHGKNWLLSPLDRYKSHQDYVAHMNKALKKIGLHYTTSSKVEGKILFPGLTTYSARHSWASIAANLDVPMEIIGRALGHSWVTNTVTSIYINFDNRKVDEANRKVLDAILTE